RSAGDDVVLAIVNQADLDAIADANGEGWPWPREYWAVLTRFLSDAGASVIGFDLFFSEPSRYPEDDRALGEAIADSGRAVLAVSTSAVAAARRQQPAPGTVPFDGDPGGLAPPPPPVPRAPPRPPRASSRRCRTSGAMVRPSASPTCAATPTSSSAAWRRPW